MALFFKTYFRSSTVLYFMLPKQGGWYFQCFFLGIGTVSQALHDTHLVQWVFNPDGPEGVRFSINLQFQRLFFCSPWRRFKLEWRYNLLDVLFPKEVPTFLPSQGRVKRFEFTTEGHRFTILEVRYRNNRRHQLWPSITRRGWLVDFTSGDDEEGFYLEPFKRNPAEIEEEIRNYLSCKQKLNGDVFPDLPHDQEM
jgi:hypothetical protein